ncbi:MAG: glycosyltransferase family 2 protein [Acidithiobacillus ferrivorans]
MEQVDILLATYNGSSYIDEFFYSIAGQSYSEWRLIIRDDGSTDDTLYKVKRFADNHRSKVVLIEDGDNLGIIGNFAELMASSSAQYVFFADQDDVWLPDKIENTMTFASGIEGIDGMPVLIHTDLKVVNESLGIISESLWQYQGLYAQRGKLLKDVMVQNVVTGCAMMVNRQLLELSLPIPANVRMHDWWLAMVACALGRIYFIPKQTILYRQHGGNDTGAKSYSISSAFRKLKGWNGIHRSILLTQVQAGEFLKKYSDVVSERDAAVLLGYSLMAGDRFFKKRVKAVNLRLRKHGIMRTVGFYVFM